MGICVGKDFPKIRPPPKRRFSEGSDGSEATLCGSRNSDVRQRFRFSAVIGRGSFGTVREAYRLHPPSAHPYAIKSVSKSLVDSMVLRREVDVVQSLRHPNIARCYAVFEDEEYVHIVMERCAGGDLLDRIISERLRTEQQVKLVFGKISSAVEYLHKNCICHRDLKAEHVLFDSQKEDSEVKLIDFGLARRFGAGEMNSFVGSPIYMAPEVLEGKYGVECDVWALGVLLFFMLVGKPPFYAEDKEDVFKSILAGELNLSRDITSPTARDLIKRMLVPDATKRFSLLEVLQHPWLSHDETKDSNSGRNEEWVHAAESIGVR